MADSIQMTDTLPAGLIRAIRRWDLVALGVNFIVGAGIFGLPSRVHSLAGPASLLAYGVCATAVILIVLCFAEVSSRFAQTGGPYLYARAAFGPLVGFQVGWLRWLSGLTTFAANCNLMIDYLGYFWPAATMGFWRVWLLSTVTVSMTGINVIGVRDAASVSNFFAVGKLLPLLVFSGVGLFFVSPASFIMPAAPTYTSLATSALLLVYAFTGFESVPVPAGEVHDPQRTVPFALFTTIGLVTLLYVLIQIVCIGTLPGLSDSTRPLADAAQQFLGNFGGAMISAGAVVSIAGNLNGQLLVTPRVLFAIAEQQQLPRFLAATHPRFRTPHHSIIVSAALILALALTGTFLQMATLSVIARVAMYGATCAALPILRRRRDLLAPAFKLRWGTPAAVVGTMLCLWLLSNSTRQEALIAVVAMAVSLPLYFGYRVRFRTSESCSTSHR
ncbi:MAG: amino acid permease [Acidobacteriota bacterium]